MRTCDTEMSNDIATLDPKNMMSGFAASTGIQISSTTLKLTEGEEI